MNVGEHGRVLAGPPMLPSFFSKVIVAIEFSIVFIVGFAAGALSTYIQNWLNKNS